MSHFLYIIRVSLLTVGCAIMFGSLFVMVILLAKKELTGVIGVDILGLSTSRLILVSAIAFLWPSYLYVRKLRLI